MRLKEPMVIVIKEVSDVPEYAIFLRRQEKQGKKTVEVEEQVIRPMAINTCLAHLQKYLVYKIFNYDDETKPSI